MVARLFMRCLFQSHNKSEYMSRTLYVHVQVAPEDFRIVELKLSSCLAARPFLSMPALGVKKKRKKKLSYARMTPAMRNRIIGMRMVGTIRDVIREKAAKSNGASPSLRAVGNILERFSKDPDWDGGDSIAGGRKRLITPQQKRQVF